MSTTESLPVGSIVRYSDKKPTALMRVDKVISFTGFHRYFGEHCLGGDMSAGITCTLVSPGSADEEIWLTTTEHRRPPT